MPKRKKRKVSDDPPADPNPPTDPRKIMHQRLNVLRLEDLLELDLEPNTQMSLANMAAYYTYTPFCTLDDVEQTKTTTLSVEYAQNKDNPNGRVYPVIPAGLGAQPSWVRRLLGGEYYHDVDIVNCAPTCLSYVFKKMFGQVPKLLDQNVRDRAVFFQAVRAEATCPLPDTQIKKMILVGIGCASWGHSSRVSTKKWKTPYC